MIPNLRSGETFEVPDTDLVVSKEGRLWALGIAPQRSRWFLVDGTWKRLTWREAVTFVTHAPTKAEITARVEALKARAPVSTPHRYAANRFSS